MYSMTSYIYENIQFFIHSYVRGLIKHDACADNGLHGTRGVYFFVLQYG